MDDLFFAAEEHQALAEPMAEVFTKSSAVHQRPAQGRPRPFVVLTRPNEVVRHLLLDWLLPPFTAPPAWV